MWTLLIDSADSWNLDPYSPAQLWRPQVFIPRLSCWRGFPEDMDLETQTPAQVGRYFAKTKFGCITHCDSADLNGIDGILGLGMPDAAFASIPEPLLFALSDEMGDPANQVRMGVAIQLM